MKKNIKRLSLLMGAVSLCTCFMTVGCNNSSANLGNVNDNDVVTETPAIPTPSIDFFDAQEPAKTYEPYSVRTSYSGKDYIMDSRGNSMLSMSSQILADLHSEGDGYTPAELEPYFKLIADTGYNTVDIPILWKQVETEKNVYTAETINVYMDLAKKYNLKINLLWYGSLKDGQTETYTLPDYVKNDPQVYSVYKTLFGGGIYGDMSIMDWTDKDTLRREGLGIINLLKFVAEWNEANDEYNPVVILQVGQGVDRFYKWRIEQYDVVGADGNPLTQAVSDNMTNTYITYMAAAAKFAAYKPLVRAEFCEQEAVTNQVRVVKAIAGVDMVAPTYMEEVIENRNAVDSFAKLDDSPVILSENWSSDQNYKHLLTTLVSGGVGYNSYAISPATHYPVDARGSLYSRMNESTKTFTEIGTRATDTKKVLNMINKAPWALTTVNNTAITALGLDNRLKPNNVQKTYLTLDNKCVFVDYTVPNDAKALGFVAFELNDYGYYLYVSCTANATLKFSRCDIIYAQSGVQNADGSFTKDNDKNYDYATKTFNVSAGEMIRIKITNILDKPTNKELSESGYVNPKNSLRG